MKIFDPVHRFIHFTSLEADLIDSKPFQRLRYIHQVGLTYLIYPGTTHTRFEHSMGTMHLASQIVDVIMRRDNLSDEVRDVMPGTVLPELRAYWKQVVRLAALCHDLGHSPFSHTTEELIPSEYGHEEMTYKIIQSPLVSGIWKKIITPLGQNITLDVIKLAIGEKHLNKIAPEITFTPWERVLSQIITADYFGADRIDYLLRDAFFSGVAYGCFDYDQITETVRILPRKGEDGNLIFSLGIHESGLQAVEGLLLARYFMHSRVYQHPRTKAYSFHLKRFVKEYFKEQDPWKDLDSYLEFTDNEVLVAIRLAAKDETIPGHMEAQRILNRHLSFRCLPLRLGAYSKKDRVKRLREVVKQLEGEFPGKVAYDSRDIVLEKRVSFDEDILCQSSDNTISWAGERSQLFSHIPTKVDPIYILVDPSVESTVAKRLAMISD